MYYNYNKQLYYRTIITIKRFIYFRYELISSQLFIFIVRFDQYQESFFKNNTRTH